MCIRDSLDGLDVQKGCAGLQAGVYVALENLDANLLLDYRVQLNGDLLRLVVDDLDPLIVCLQLHSHPGRIALAGLDRAQVHGRPKTRLGDRNVGRRDVADAGHGRHRIRLHEIPSRRLVHRVDGDRAGPRGCALQDNHRRIQDGGQQHGPDLERPVPDDEAHHSHDAFSSVSASPEALAERPRPLPGLTARRVNAPKRARLASARTDAPRGCFRSWPKMPPGVLGWSSAVMARSRFGPSRLRTMRALSTRLIWPLSSDTTTTIASVCSVMPRAALWRVPKRSSGMVVSAEGSTAPAARMRSPLITTAPSWSGVFGEKRVTSRSAERSAWSITPFSAISCRPVSRSMTIRAP